MLHRDATLAFTTGLLCRPGMIEAEARVLLRDWPGVGGIEAWIAGRRWKAVPGGWTVTGELEGWQFRIDVIAGGLRLTAGTPEGGKPAVWIVTG
jgi:hypothetical protein